MSPSDILTTGATVEQHFYILFLYKGYPIIYINIIGFALAFLLLYTFKLPENVITYNDHKGLTLPPSPPMCAVGDVKLWQRVSRERDLWGRQQCSGG